MNRSILLSGVNIFMTAVQIQSIKHLASFNGQADITVAPIVRFYGRNITNYIGIYEQLVIIPCLVVARARS